jgi:hypothetical protein
LKVELCTGGCEDRTLVGEDEKSPLLEAVVREQLIKTQQTGRGQSVEISDNVVNA